MFGSPPVGRPLSEGVGFRGRWCKEGRGLEGSLLGSPSLSGVGGGPVEAVRPSTRKGEETVGVSGLRTSNCRPPLRRRGREWGRDDVGAGGRSGPLQHLSRHSTHTHAPQPPLTSPPLFSLSLSVSLLAFTRSPLASGLVSDSLSLSISVSVRLFLYLYLYTSICASVGLSLPSLLLGVSVSPLCVTFTLLPLPGPLPCPMTVFTSDGARRLLAPPTPARLQPSSHAGTRWE